MHESYAFRTWSSFALNPSAISLYSTPAVLLLTIVAFSVSVSLLLIVIFEFVLFETTGRVDARDFM